MAGGEAGGLEELISGGDEGPGLRVMGFSGKSQDDSFVGRLMIEILAAGESPAGAIVAAGRRGRRCLEVHVRRGGSLDWHGCRAEGEKNVLDTEPPVITGGGSNR